MRGGVILCAAWELSFGFPHIPVIQNFTPQSQIQLKKLLLLSFTQILIMSGIMVFRWARLQWQSEEICLHEWGRKRGNQKLQQVPGTRKILEECKGNYSSCKVDEMNREEIVFS